MTAADQLRADADRREALANACPDDPWERDGDYGISTANGEKVADFDQRADAALALANNPVATLASCKRDTLLADVMDWLGSVDFFEANDRRANTARQGELLARFTALGSK